MKLYRKHAIIFIILNAILVFWFIDLWPNAQNTSRSLPVVSLYEHGHLYFDRYHQITGDKSIVNNHYYSDKAPLPTFVIIPVFGLMKVIGIIKPVNGSLLTPAIFAIGGFFCGSLPFLIILWLIYKNLIRNKINPFDAALNTMLPLYGSFLFVFSGTYFGHLFSAMFLLLAYIRLTQNRFLACGIFSGLAFLSEYSLALFFMIWCVQVLFRHKSVKKTFWLVAGFIPSVILIMIYNYCITGFPTDMIYNHVTQDYAAMKTQFGFYSPSAKALWGLTFSVYRGIFIYMPYLILPLIYFFVKFKRSDYKILFTDHLFLPSIFFLIFISSYFSWWGGWSYGPRHLTAPAVMITWTCVVWLLKNNLKKYILLPVCGVGIILTFISKVTAMYSIPTEIKNPFSGVLFPQFMAQQINDNNMLSIIFKASPAVSVYIWFAIFIGVIVYYLYSSINTIQNKV